MSLSDYYTQSIVIYSRTTSTGWGSESGYSTAGTSAAASVNMLSERESIGLDRERAHALYRMHMSDTVSITPSCKVVWSGTTLNVVKVKDTLQMGHHKNVLLVEPL